MKSVKAHSRLNKVANKSCPEDVKFQVWGEIGAAFTMRERCIWVKGSRALLFKRPLKDTLQEVFL